MVIISPKGFHFINQGCNPWNWATQGIGSEAPLDPEGVKQNHDPNVKSEAIHLTVVHNLIFQHKFPSFDPQSFTI
jgi:hypothetical protein